MQALKALIAKFSALPLWQQRSQSERRTLQLAALLLAAMGLYQFVILPARASLRALESRTAEQGERIATLQSQLSQQQAPSVPLPSMTSALSLPAQVETALVEAGFKGALKKIEPISEREIRVELSGINFDRLISTIELLANMHQISVSELSIDAIAPSTVNARIRFAK